MEKDWIEISQLERDVVKVKPLVLCGERTQVEGARWIGRSERQVRRLLVQLRGDGDSGVVHGLRGRPSNHRLDRSVRRRALKLCVMRYAGFGPTLAFAAVLELSETVGKLGMSQPGRVAAWRHVHTTRKM